MKIVSVILARGGSKGIPRKNIIDFNGAPLIGYTIDASIKSKVHETWVSTDDEEIAKISSKLGANTLIRPSSISIDTSPSEEALLHFAKYVDFDIMVFIQPTSPLLEYKYINKGIKMMDKYDSVFSVYKEHWYPRWSKENILGSDISLPIEWNVNKRPRRQDMEETYVENGAFYITTKSNLLKSKVRYSKNIGMVEMPLEKSFQIDTLEDLELMKKLL